MAPLGNGVLFLLFLIVSFFPVLLSGMLYPLAERLVGDHGDVVGKLRMAGWARLLALPLLLPIFSWVTNLIRMNNNLSSSMPSSIVMSLAITPVILLTAYSLMAIFQKLGSSPGQEHPLVQLFRSGQKSDVLLVLGLVLVMAPITEEVIFRGLFQQWIISAFHGPVLGWLMSLFLVVSQLIGSNRPDSPVSLLWSQVAVFMILGAVAIGLGSIQSRKTASIMSGAMVFAAVHSFAWPSPAGLLPLAWGLGWLREMTGRIWPCVIVHALFNCAGTMLI